MLAIVQLLLISSGLVRLALPSLVVEVGTIRKFRRPTVQGSWLAAVTVSVLLTFETLSFTRPVPRVHLDRAHIISLLFRHDMGLMGFQSLHPVVMIAILMAVLVVLLWVPGFVRESSSASVLFLLHTLVALLGIYGVHITHIDWLFIREHDPAVVIRLNSRGEAAYSGLVAFLALLPTISLPLPLTLLLRVLIF